MSLTGDAEAVLREALALPPDDRADLVAELIASLDEPADDSRTVRALWAEELQKRAKRALSGQSPEEDWADVRQRLADELAG